MKEALIIRNTSIPLYLDLLEQELAAINSNNINEVNFKMYCFWNGEKQLGSLEGVLDVEPGFIDHSEVVKVKYNSALISDSELKSYAEKQNFEPINTSGNFRTATRDVHYYLQHSDYKYLPLSEIQKTKINSALGSQQLTKNYLSPKQIKWLGFLQSNKEMKYPMFHNQEIANAWGLMEMNYIRFNKKQASSP